MSQIRRMLVATDGSQEAERAGLTAIELAGKLGSNLTLLNVVSHQAQYYGFHSHQVATGLGPSDQDQTYTKRLDESIRTLSKTATSKGIQVDSDTVDAGQDIVGAIADYAYEQGIDLIVVGTRGLNEFQESIEGSVSEGLVRKAHCSVLVVK